MICPKCNKKTFFDFSECPNCGHDIMKPSESKGGDQKQPSTTVGTIIEVLFPNSERKQFDKWTLREEIVRGNLTKDCKARILKAGENKPSDSKEESWQTLGSISKSDFKLQILYTPIWAHTMKGLAYGALVGIILKAIDTTVLLFQLDPTAGIIWLLIVASLCVTKWFKWATIIAILLSIRSGVKANLFVTVIAVMIVGFIFGGPAGMAVGTLTGYFRKKNLPKAPDASDEGLRPVLLGFVAPIIFLAITIPFYIFWLTPKMAEWFS
jgi:hypothetical protein